MRVTFAQAGNAKGHFITDEMGNEVPQVVDIKTLQLFAELGNAKPNGVKVKMSHNSGVSEIVGKLTDFQVDGEKGTAELTLFEESEHYELLNRLATELPSEFGLSAYFSFDHEDGLIRPKELFSIDIEPETATTPNGLYKLGKGLQFSQNQYNATNMDETQVRDLITAALAPVVKYMEETKPLLEKLMEGDKPEIEVELSKTKQEVAEMKAKVEAADALIAAMTAKLDGLSAFQTKIAPNFDKPLGDDFEELVKAKMRAGKEKSLAIGLAARENPVAYQKYCAAGKVGNLATLKL